MLIIRNKRSEYFKEKASREEAALLSILRRLFFAQFGVELIALLIVV